jgi:hypothetical protein
LVLVVQRLGLGPGGGDCPLEQVGALEGGQERLQDGLVELLGGQPVGRAGVGAVALSGEAHVVAVAVAVTAAVGGRADEVLAAVNTADPTGQQVFGGVAGPLGVGLATLGEQRVGGVEDGLVDQGLVLALYQMSRKNTSPR